MKRPTSVTIIGVVWFSIGLLGMVGNSVKEHGLQIPDSNFINLLVGVGLLSGWRICRWYALFVTGCTFAMVILCAPWALLNSGRMALNFPALIIDDRPHEIMALWLVALILLSYLILSGWSFWVLKRSEVREFFTPRTAVTV